MISVKNNTVTVSTKTLDAVIENGCLKSLANKKGEYFIEHSDINNGSLLSLRYTHGETVPVRESKICTINSHQTNEHEARIIFNGWYGEGILIIKEDLKTGDLMIAPSVSTKREGLLACRMNINGIRNDLRVAAPLYQGVNLEQNDSLIKNAHFRWPIEWEAGFCIWNGSENGFWIHTQDTKYIYKALQLGIGEHMNNAALDTEAYGPIDGNKAAGGIVWRINTYEGDWRIPVKLYSDWMFTAYDIRQTMSPRPEWLDRLKLAVSWCPTRPEILDALNSKCDPDKVLIHLPNWRNFGYDENYPDFLPDKKGLEFINKAKELGFHVLPHANSVDMDPTNPAYHSLEGFAYRDIETKKYLGWGWDKDVGVMDVPQAGYAFNSNRGRKVMIKAHPGLAMWRTMLALALKDSIAVTGVDSMFLDVTLCSFNLHNALVENTTSTEGMKMLLSEMSQIGKGLFIGGEGLNEITFQNLCFAQMHLFRSHQKSCGGLERTGNCNMNTILYGGLTKLFGYSALSGHTEDSVMRMRITEDHDAIPTITIGSEKEILEPNEAVKMRLFESK